MRDFDYSDLKNKTWDHEILSYVAKIHEYKGRQALFLQQEPVELQRLIEVAMIQSTESSNRIEGIVTTRSRLLQLVENKTTPRNHDEKEILGYRNVLNIIHSSYEYIPLRSNYILQLHRDLLQYTPFSYGGKYKTAPNEIEQICDNYQKALDLEIVDPLILIPCVIFDFLCVHPFHDGNGRMSHLLTLLLLYRNGYMVGKYISIEKEIADTKEAYYQALEQADAGWHEGANDPTPFIKYMLGILLKCYREFEERLTISEKSGKRSTVYDIVKNYAISTLGTFTKKDVVENCPSVARSSIEAALKKLVDDGTLHRKGKGRSSHYIRSDSTK
ncbi:Fic family protein [uncultured Dubosiella sp.]|uniref:Fic family protein n=2 Tax=uncultured Dubosiella sp. TaxID=1937011 RepID=UPI00258B66E9|nr:Fic family protein [uncultured Dubosiella sp.]